jgi:hypothetical protein
MSDKRFNVYGERRWHGWWDDLGSVERVDDSTLRVTFGSGHDSRTLVIKGEGHVSLLIEREVKTPKYLEKLL